MPRVSFIPCLTWVKQGKVKPDIEKIKISKKELEEIIQELKLKENETVEQEEPKELSTTPAAVEPDNSEQSGEEEEDEISKLYDLDNYDNENVEPGTGIESLILNNSSESDSEDSDAEEDEFKVKPDDNLILVGHVENDVCTFEVYVFNNANAELFILHDFFLPSYPICIEWLDFNPNDSENRGNFAAVGTLTPEIEFWDLSVSGCLESAFQLGGRNTKKSQKHKDAVLDLTWHPLNRNILASAGADKTVLLWDLAQLNSVARLSHFEDKIQAIKFHPLEPYSLLTGCSDGKARLYDCRSPSTFKAWEFSEEIERIIWNRFNPNCYYTSTSNGMVYHTDIRNQKNIWSLRAHNDEVTGLALSSHCKDLLVTGCMDSTVKVWDLKDDQPSFVTEKSMNIGKILTLTNCPDVPYVFCAGGNKKDNFMYLWDVRENDAVVQRFQDRNLEEIHINIKNEQGTNPDNDNPNSEPMDQDSLSPASSSATEPQPCSSSSLAHPRTRLNNQKQFEGAIKKRKNKSRKVVKAMLKDEAVSGGGPSTTFKLSKSARRKRNRPSKKDVNNKHPKSSNGPENDSK